MLPVSSQLDLFSPQDNFDYTVRVSRRARRLQLRVLPAGLVEVVLPARMARRYVEPFVEQHRPWVLAELRRLQQQHPRSPQLDEALPRQLYFPCLQQTLELKYDSGRTYRQGDILHVRAGSDEQMGQALRRWLLRLAAAELPAYFSTVARGTALSFNSVRVRRQRTLWGSCNSRGHISLNSNLMFLPEALARYVCIHELCHTVHLNHSPAFWSLVGTHMPDYRLRERELKLASRYIPRCGFE